MDRRRFMLASPIAVLAAPLAAWAQQVGKPPRIGLIAEASASSAYLNGFRQGLRELGYRDGENIVVEYRYTHGLTDQVRALAAELIRLDVDILVVGGTVSAQSAKAVTATVPIVFALAGDPVGSGLVASLARPGGNATGLSNLAGELVGKQLEILKAAVPRISRIGVLYNPGSSSNRVGLDGARATARILGVEVQALELQRPNDLPSVFFTLTTWRVDALLALGDPVIGSQLSDISKLAARNRVPTMYVRREFPEAGGLMAYGPSFTENYRRAAYFVDRILKGAKPAELPVEQPTKFELVINLKTAKTLGLTIPPSL
jgi:putative ABC transport system substrate-binding protein